MALNTCESRREHLHVLKGAAIFSQHKGLAIDVHRHLLPHVVPEGAGLQAHSTGSCSDCCRQLARPLQLYCAVCDLGCTAVSVMQTHDLKESWACVKISCSLYDERGAQPLI